MPYGGHTLPAVYRVMAFQLCADYPGIPDVMDMKMNRIRWFYEGLRPGLKKTTKPGR